MDFFTALALLQEQVPFSVLLAIALGLALIYYGAFRGRVHHLFDPLGWVLAFSCVTLILLFVLQLQDLVPLSKALWTVSVLVVFYGSFLLFSGMDQRRRGRTAEPELPPMRAPGSAALLILLAVNTTLWLATYVFFGIPLFLDSRLEQFAQGGGVGLLSRLTSGLDFICLMMGMLSLRLGGRSRALGYMLVLESIVNALLSGSKSGLISLVFGYYLVEVGLQRRWNVRLRLSAGKLLLVSLIFMSPLAVLATKGGDGSTGVVEQLFTRVAAEGDGYVMFYANDLIDDLARFDPLALLRPLLVTFRLAPLETMVNPGYEVITAVLGIDSPTTGPNARLPVFLYFFYGWGGILLAVPLGAGLYLARRAVHRSTGRTALRFSFVCSIYVLCTKLEVDPQLTVNGLVNLLIVTPILGLVLLSEMPRPRQTPQATMPGEAR